MSIEEREKRKLNGPGNYRVIDNVVYTRAIEINAARHCNLSCRGCSHASPIAKEQYYDISKLEEDLTELSKYMKCEIIRIVGGEPLLHPNFEELVKSIRKSGISEKISLITNGVLLPSIDESLLENLDEMEVSLYPLSEKIREKIMTTVQGYESKFKKLRILEYNFFREPRVQNSSSDKELIQKIYETCQIAHFWRCLTVDNGYLYRCPQSMVEIEKINDYSNALNIFELDSCDELLEFLEKNEAPEFCSNCLGSVGKTFSHEQIKRDIWEEFIPVSYEDGIDTEQVKLLVKNAQGTNGCVIRKKI